MPLLFIAIGIVFVVSGVRNTSDQLLTLIKSDFTGQGNYLYWLLAVLIVGAIGYAPSAKQFSNAFLALIVIAMLLRYNNFFTAFSSNVNATSTRGASTSNVLQMPSTGILSA